VETEAIENLAPRAHRPDFVSSLLEAGERKLRYKNSMRLLDYWANEGGQQQFDPIDVPALLPNLYLLEAIGARFHYRVSGEAVNSLFGSQHRGKFLDEVVPEAIYPTVAPFFQSVARNESAFFFQGRVAISNRDFLFFERLILPVQRGGNTMVVGCLSLSNTDKKRPESEPEARGYDFTVVDRTTGTVREIAHDIPRASIISAS
jgi:hypothetical protein